MKKLLNLTNKKTELLNKKARILCAVSGGQDSTSTCFVLLHAKIVHLEIIYCQHFWQIKNFFSVNLLFKINFLLEIPYNIILPGQFYLTENYSRGWRKKNFYRVATAEKTTILVTGQTLTDTLETSLIHLIRGTSPNGLSQSNCLNYKKTNLLFFSSFIVKPTFPKKSLNLIGKTSPVLEHETSVIKRKKDLVKTFCFFKKTNKKIIYPKKKKATTLNFTFFCFLKNKLNHNKNIIFPMTKQLFCHPEQRTSSSFCIYSKTIQMKIRLTKPFLEQNRFKISKFLQFYNFPIINDVTNLSAHFSRNKIRHTLFPLIRYLFNRKFEFLINNFLQTLKLEQTLIENEILQNVVLLKSKKLLKPKKLNLPDHKKICKREKTKQLLVHLPIRNLSYLSKVPRSLIQRLFSDYKDMELTYLQISVLENQFYFTNDQVWVTRDSNPELIG